MKNVNVEAIQNFVETQEEGRHGGLQLQRGELR